MPDRFRDIRERFIRGRLSSPADGDKLVFEAVGNLRGIERICVAREDFPPGVAPEELRRGESEIDLFLVNPTVHDPHTWYGHAGWASDGGSANPWLQDPPRINDVVRGEVVAYIHDYACAVRLDQSAIEAFLHREYLPNPPEGLSATLPITRQLFVGDRIEAVVIEVNATQLQVRLSVTDRLRALREQRQNEKSGNTAMSSSRDEDRDKRALPKWGSKHVLLIEDDEVLAESLQKLVRHAGWMCDWSRNPVHTRQLLTKRGGKYDAVLLDYHVQTKGQRADCERLLIGQRIALISGDHDEARKHAENRKYSWLPKPIDWEQLYHFVCGADLPATDSPLVVDRQRWSSGEAATRLVARQRKLLERLQEKLEAVGVLWLLERRKDVYQLAGRAGFAEATQEGFEQLAGLWSQTLVADAHAHPGSAHECSVSSSGLLRRVAPARATHVVAVAASLAPDRPAATGTSILVFFRDHALRESDGPRLDLARWCAEDLADRLAIAQRLEDQDSFAMEGRLAAGLIHEIAGALSPLNSLLDGLRMKMEQASLPATTVGPTEKELLAAAVGQAKRVTWLARNSLSAIQSERPPVLALPADLEAYCRMLAFVAGKREITLRADLNRLPNIRLQLPQAVIEQVLLNLFDNARHYSETRSWATIDIQADWEGEHRLPLRIDFSDTGFGMTAEARSRLFEPRHTGRGRSGFGLGLYVSRNLVESIGGTLECTDSLRWVGSNFRLRLPGRLATKGA